MVNVPPYFGSSTVGVVVVTVVFVVVDEVDADVDVDVVVVLLPLQDPNSMAVKVIQIMK
jgi:hypothetical protein